MEHDEETIRAADWVVDLGEGAGRNGGRLMYQGPPGSIDGSLTGRYLRGELRIEVPSARRTPRATLRVLGAREHNLQDIDVEIPLGVFTAVTGVSGAGKSTLVDDILQRALARRLWRRPRAGATGRSRARTPSTRSSPSTRAPSAARRAPPAAQGPSRSSARCSAWCRRRARGYKPGRFSFGRQGGRCEACQGDGVRTIGMHFLPDVYVSCGRAAGGLQPGDPRDLYHGRTVADVLDMTVAEAQPVLAAHPGSTACS